MEITGTIRNLFETKDVSANFKKREVVITTEEQYPQHLMVEFTQDRCALLNGYRNGDKVKVSINLRGREWQSPQGDTRYFVSIQGWRIDRLDNAEAAPLGVPSATDFSNEEPDDLPF